MFYCLKLVTLGLWLSVSCESTQCPTNCTCHPFGKLTQVKCAGIGQVPTGIPSNTVLLDLSGNDLKSIHEDAFDSFTLLRKIDLSRNLLKFIPQNTFRNLTSLAIIELPENALETGFYLHKSVYKLDLRSNALPFGEFKTILKGLNHLTVLSMSGCNIEYIESGTFRAMLKLSFLDLSKNKLTQIQPFALEGPGDELLTLLLHNNKLRMIADRTFIQFHKLHTIRLQDNLLRSVPDLTGLKTLQVLDLKRNRITDISRLRDSGDIYFWELSLDNNQITHLPKTVFQTISVIGNLDLSFNKLQSVPDNTFIGFERLLLLSLSFNNITYINRHTFAGLKLLSTLMMIKNNLTYIPKDAFAGHHLQSLFLHSNAIEHIDYKAFDRLTDLKSLTLFDNPLTSLPDGIFNNMTSNTKVSITCNSLQQLPLGRYTSVIECAPSATFRVLLDEDEVLCKSAFENTGFVCRPCIPGYVPGYMLCFNCSLCRAGLYNDDGFCLSCPAGGFYQDQMGQVHCKKCSVGTYVSVERHPATRATDCWACPYGTLSNETAGYRACRCLRGFYRVDRFGPCSECPAHSINCVNDTAILASNYYWKWSNRSNKEFYKKFVSNLHCFGPCYNDMYSKFTIPLPKPVKCPYAGSCKGGIDSECYEGYQGNLCATCTNGYYLRFNSCLKCPRLTVSIISSVLVVALFVVVFLVVVWGDSKRTENNRTVADVIMSCFKIVIGFYQVIAGIFSALTRVQWPVALISMEKYLKLFEGNVFQFAPLSCIHPLLRLDQFMRFVLVLSVNVAVVSLHLFYLFIKKRYINRKMDRPDSEKLLAVSCLKKSCCRNIFLFLLATYPITSKTIIQILPLPGACVTQCFTDDKNQCISLLRADYSIHCFTARHELFWPFAAVFSLYPVGFPLLVLLLIYKYRESQANEELAFGLKVFFENYKKKFWFWEIIEMYRKLILISLIFLFYSESFSQISLTVFSVSVFGVTYTCLRPIKGKFEDRLQTFVLWVIFFDVCLGVMYNNCDVNQDHKGNDSLLVNILFVALNSLVLLVALGKGIVHVKFFWEKVSSCLMQCFHFVGNGIIVVKRKIAGCFQSFTFFTPRTQPFEQQPFLIHEIT